MLNTGQFAMYFILLSKLQLWLLYKDNFKCISSINYVFWFLQLIIFARLMHTLANNCLSVNIPIFTKTRIEEKFNVGNINRTEKSKKVTNR